VTLERHLSGLNPAATARVWDCLLFLDCNTPYIEPSFHPPPSHTRVAC
jgi:hypothetical protein